MHNHDHLHRRQGRAAFPDPKAIAEAIADAFPNPFAKAEPQRTVVSVVYITASATFDGPIGGYMTLGANQTPDDTKNNDDEGEDDKKETRTTPAKTTAQPIPVTTKQPEPSKQQTKEIVADTSAPSPVPVTTKAKQTTFQTSSSSLPSEISKPTAALTSSAAAVVVASGTPTRSKTFTKTSAVNLQAEATESAKPVETGMSTGGKAGLAIGILLLVGAILALALFAFKKRKQKAKQQELDNEKSAMAFAAAGRPASQRTNPKAPRLSLRPVTQFLPNLGEKRASRGNVLAAAAAVTPMRQQPAPENNRNNPFSDAKAIDSVNANGPSPVQINGPDGEIIVAAAATGVGAGLARGASKRGDKPRDFTTKGGFMAPASPNGTEFSQTSETPTTTGHGPTTSGAAIAAAGGPANTAVHRVQLDFKPSMEDELELRAGQLIRLLHEYDDGWALCIRLDRSQQGVVPRTCLSTRPVKPRPQQPGQTPRGSPQGQRGPQGQMRPMSPGMNGPRPSSPAGGRNSPAPGQRPMTPQGQQQRPMTPQGQQQRPMTPQGQGRPRSPSVAQQQGRRQSPPGPSPMNPSPQTQELSSSPPSVGRKPVPGQAL